MARITHSYNLPTTLLNITPKPDFLKCHFCTDIPVIMPKKKDNFYIYILSITKCYKTLKSHKKDPRRGLISYYYYMPFTLMFN